MSIEVCSNDNSLTSSSTMKGGGSRKEPPVAGEVTGKRPKRKCLQWHPLLSKKALDFSEEEEEEDEEEQGKPELCYQGQRSEVQCRSTTEEVEEESNEHRARRPMNAFLLFCKRHRSLVRQEHPRLDNRGATKILADWWAVLEATEKQKYTDMAKEYKEAFMKANPGYRWCPTTSKPLKSPSCPPVSSPRKRVWSFPSNMNKDSSTARKVPQSDSTPQLNFAMADPTKMGGLSMLLLAGEHALTNREVSSTKPSLPDTASGGHSCPGHQQKVQKILSGSICNRVPDRTESRVTSAVSPPSEPCLSVGPELKPCRESALFQLAEMCLASEAGQIETVQSHPEDSPPKACLQPSPLVPMIKEEKVDIDACPHPIHTSAISPVLSCATSTSADTIQSQLSSQTISSQTVSSQTVSSQTACVEYKSEKKETEKLTNKEDMPSSAKKILKKCNHAEPNIDPVFSTIEAVAKGAWKDSEEQKKKIQTSASGGNSRVPKKKSKTKVKTLGKEKEDFTEDSSRRCEQDSFSEIDMMEETDISLKTETEETNAGSTDLQDNAAKCHSPCSPLLVTFKEKDQLKDRSSDGTCETNTESRGSRKSERSCKGALYKTLVSEGMLTSLRANIDRGKRGVFRAPEHDTNWSDDSWTVSQLGANNPKKLKKSKSKDESSQALGKLEEEFERKFNSLPQYSPVTFDKKGTAVTKKKKTDCSTVQEDISKSTKGPSPSQKKTSFHKIVRKHKHKKEKPGALEKVVQSDSSILDSASCAPITTMCPDGQGAASMEMLVGSQKRKARKTKITHLVRTADGSVSPVEVDKSRDLNQEQDKKPLSQQSLCNDTGCCSDPPAEVSTEPQELPAFFSLAALAEVAAMENVHRGQRNLAEGQKTDLTPTPVLISCADQ
ncbi:HMG box transcription factor BBX isoform X2 [Antennarius striatus]|uniref:HMG box transcription factor BBX isoform X2 n=1 Tax=Antennarius striatus TaxID=241820 RepID=UPI0035ADC06C